MIETYGSIQPLEVDMGEFKAKPTAITEGQVEASTVIWEAGGVVTGLWECTEGVFTASRDGYTEICTILSGRCKINADGEEAKEYGPGDVVVMPSGWKGQWEIIERVRKHFTTIND